MVDLSRSELEARFESEGSCILDIISYLQCNYQLTCQTSDNFMELKKAQDIFSLSTGSVVTKRNLYDLVQFSKVEESPYWSGIQGMIGNTPQQGINWIGLFPKIDAVIIKTRPGSYENDGWADETKTLYHYSFKARNGEISYAEKANKALVKQPQYLYPIFLFTECKDGWYFEGTFSVSEIENEFVVLHRGVAPLIDIAEYEVESIFHEGEKKYVTHLMAERSKGAAQVLKSIEAWICDICSEDFFVKYGVKYIEVHHRIPISTYSSSHTISLSDLALLCPNCHKAVHIYMKKDGYDYAEIKKILGDRN
jgi:putative restriction endonuclease